MYTVFQKEKCIIKFSVEACLRRKLEEAGLRYNQMYLNLMYLNLKSMAPTQSHNKFIHSLYIHAAGSLA